ncbi:MAG: MobC family plasmid mobilization relaxosome protein [Erysipelotrichaceae bacterium]|nr:MobC family plasmid mobilization relaxosome protein [Erysipelotrichaceae bacterium]
MSRRKNKSYLVRFTEEEFASFEKLAEEYNVTKQRLITSLITLNIPPPPLNEDFYSALKELRYIGNNLNQIARVANTIKDINYAEYKQYADMVVSEILNIKQIIARPIKLEQVVIQDGDNKDMGY